MKIDFEIEPLGDYDLFRDNVDIYVYIKDQRFTATFFTIKNIESLMDSYQKSGECLSGSFFWASNMLIVKDLSLMTIKRVVAELIATNEFEDIFVKVE